MRFIWQRRLGYFLSSWIRKAGYLVNDLFTCIAILCNASFIPSFIPLSPPVSTHIHTPTHTCARMRVHPLQIDVQISKDKTEVRVRK